MKLLVADWVISHIELISGHVKDYFATKKLYCISLSAWTEAYLQKGYFITNGVRWGGSMALWGPMTLIFIIIPLK